MNDVQLSKDFDGLYLATRILIFALSPRVIPPGERGGLVVNASDSGSRGGGFEPHSGQTMLCP